MDIIGKTVSRKDAWEKVTGQAVYTGDKSESGMLYAEKVISPYGHALIKNMDLSKAKKIKGVKAIITGGNLPLTGEEIQDRYPIACEKVRYHGEVVALVVGDTPKCARQAADLIRVVYEPLPVVNTPGQAFDPNAPLVHEQLEQYKKKSTVYPEPGTNIANRSKIRKGDITKGWEKSDVVIEKRFSFNPSDHIAMETRCALGRIEADGKVLITSSSQAPFMIKRLISEYFGIKNGNVIVNTPLVGGGYGGKASIQLELLAYIASKAVGGRLVRVQNTREEDILTSPCHIGLEATIKLGCSQEGLLQAAEILYLWDGGAYSDKATSLSRAGAVDCTGPYHIDNVWCDSLCMYTNHPYASPYRGYAHSEVLFAFERTMDGLADKLRLDPLEFRHKNAIRPGDTTPTQVLLNKSNVGNLPECIDRLKTLMEWEKGQKIDLGHHKMKVKGISCVWKTSTIDTNAGSGVILTFNPDGSVNLLSGVVEIGTGTKTVLAQIVSEKLKMKFENVHVQIKVNTQNTPEHWKTVASRGTFMAGRAALQAADDAIGQLKHLASCVLRAPVEDFEIGRERVYLRDDPSIGLSYKDLAYGYTYPNGNAIGGQIIGRGHYILRHLTYLNPETGAGKPGPEWTVGAQGVEVEFDTREYTYKITKAFSVIDAGKVLNPKMAEGQIMGAMSMGLAFGGRETFYFDDLGRVLNPQLRTYRPLRYGENPEYICEFVETPQIDAPYGSRGVGEHGLLGMPAALGNSLSLAAGVSLNQLPLLPELIWRKKEAANRGDSL
ncbi:xanthine dehydrogenase family protein molybdopterin-binding subunit [Domibacillus sp. A3M-37]|uniref:xanthine dehydrogenase family protein molybdopterin-binding subunit n=1 Tax=Domibacillus sp. A3M-37 TaxID=2962037 RepID=UPI0020B8F31C|nr:xanthine dehydrogenase family protein molybdopterin-binding subunit [Domibacillus sp. A3M-37]MCP3761091.1 xanthine dehydrogenase family protein molybdopterin-binding subunit [Domibacillus sp. A3M-37]